MKTEFYIGCTICGVRKKLHKFKTCGDETKHHKLDLVGNHTARNHVWIEMKMVHGWFGKGIVETFKELEPPKPQI